MSMFNPPHPGLGLGTVIQVLGISVTEAADQLGVSRVTLSRVINGRAAISAEMALRIEAWLGVENGGSAHVWLGQQRDYDLWLARQEAKRHPMHVQRAPARPG